MKLEKKIRIFIMSCVGERENLSPNKNRTHELVNIGRVLHPLS